MPVLLCRPLWGFGSPAFFLGDEAREIFNKALLKNLKSSIFPFWKKCFENREFFLQVNETDTFGNWSPVRCNY